MAVIRAQSISEATAKELDVIEVLCRFCYHYPQYTLASARKLPFKHVRLMLSIARQEKARDYLQMTQIVAAPHTKKGAGVKSLTNMYKKEMNG